MQGKNAAVRDLVAKIEDYRKQGYLSPLAAFSSHQARAWRGRLEQSERVHGLRDAQRRKMHLYLTWVDEIARSAAILDRVENLIGPDILVYHITLWLKEPHTDAFVSWHQDSTYFGLTPADHVTAWVALSPSNDRSGCVQVIPGSHHQGQLAHDVALNPANLFPTGHQVQVDGTATVASMPLAPGEFSLHHTYLLHHSMANQSDDRRIGLGISYIPTRCRCIASTRLSASLVRGTDRFGHFDLDPHPRADHDPAALAVHARAMQRWGDARAELIPMAHRQDGSPTATGGQAHYE